MEYQLPTDIDDMGKPRHPLHGKRGPWLEAMCKDKVLRNFIWQNSGDEIVRGYQRSGIKAADFDLEAVASNEKTSPRIEIPRVVIETMRMDIRQLNAQDIAVFWRLFAQARHHGIEDTTATICMPALKAYLGVDRRDRIIASIQKLTSVSMSLHVNQPGAHGRISMPMIEAFEIDGDIVTFELPRVLRGAVINARDYAWVDLNAIARFRSKFSAQLFIKASYEAGKHWSKRQMLGGDRQSFAAALGVPASSQTSVVEDATARVRDDLLAISGPRRRFALSFDLGFGADDHIMIEIGDASRKLKELRPKRLPAAAREQVAADNKGHNSIPESRCPALIRLQQAATWLGSSVLFVAEKWRLDVYGAMTKPDEFRVGLTPREFLSLIDTHGPDDVLEFWLDKRDFAQFGGYRTTIDVGQPVTPKPKKRVADVHAVEARVREAEQVSEDDLRMAEDFGVLEYGHDPEPEFGLAAEDWNDDDIPE